DLVLEELLPSGHRRRVQPGVARQVGEVAQRRSRVEDPLPEVALPALVPLGASTFERAPLEQLGRDQQSLRQHVDAADVAVEQVDAVDALATELRVEVEPAGAQPATAEDLVQHE